jgi:hypothetical protein
MGAAMPNIFDSAGMHGKLAIFDTLDDNRSAIMRACHGVSRQIHPIERYDYIKKK